MTRRRTAERLLELMGLMRAVGRLPRDRRRRVQAVYLELLTDAADPAYPAVALRARVLALREWADRTSRV